MTMDLSRMFKGAHKGAGGGPKRTLQEMAEEFGVSAERLKQVIAYHNGPASFKTHGYATGRKTWYAPKKLRDWWYALPPEVRKADQCR